MWKNKKSSRAFGVLPAWATTMVDTFLQMRGSQIGCGSESAERIVRVAIKLGEMR